ncbi:MAG TPA: hypothetical protein DCQ33_11840 [Nitrospira sp.]|nr:hypothetical protein [Nitrospira sp.]
MKIRFSLRGMERYDALLAAIQAQNPLAADRMVIAVDRALRRLKRFPLSGSWVREFPHLSLRQIIVGSYRFFYVVSERNNVVVILDAWHVAQIPDEPQLPAP